MPSPTAGSLLLEVPWWARWVVSGDHSLATEQASAVDWQRAGHFQLNNLPLWKRAEETHVSPDLSVTSFYNKRVFVLWLLSSGESEETLTRLGSISRSATSQQRVIQTLKKKKGKNTLGDQQQEPGDKKYCSHDIYQSSEHQNGISQCTLPEFGGVGGGGHPRWKVPI